MLGQNLVNQSYSLHYQLCPKCKHWHRGHPWVPQSFSEAVMELSTSFDTVTGPLSVHSAQCIQGAHSVHGQQCTGVQSLNSAHFTGAPSIHIAELMEPQTVTHSQCSGGHSVSAALCSTPHTVCPEEPRTLPHSAPHHRARSLSRVRLPQQTNIKQVFIQYLELQ